MSDVCNWTWFEVRVSLLPWAATDGKHTPLEREKEREGEKKLTSGSGLVSSVCGDDQAISRSTRRRHDGQQAVVLEECDGDGDGEHVMDKTGTASSSRPLPLPLPPPPPTIRNWHPLRLTPGQGGVVAGGQTREVDASLVASTAVVVVSIDTRHKGREARWRHCAWREKHLICLIRHPAVGCFGVLVSE